MIEIELEEANHMKCEYFGNESFSKASFVYTSEKPPKEKKLDLCIRNDKHLTYKYPYNENFSLNTSVNFPDTA